jgi:hypothetical protein
LRASPRGRYAADDQDKPTQAEPDDLRVATDVYSTIPNRAESAIGAKFATPGLRNAHPP